MQLMTERSAPIEALIIIRAQPADGTVITHLLKEAASQNREQWQSGGFQESISQSSLMQDIEHGAVYLAMYQGQPAGTLTLRECIPADAQLWSVLRESAIPVEDALYLHRLTIRQSLAGLGLRLLQWAEHMTALSGKSALRLDCLATNAPLCAYYEQAGLLSQGVAGEQWRLVLYEKRVNR